MVDRYTKIVLTVIAAALVGIVAENATTVARAIDYNDACGTATHPACQVTWSAPMPVRVSN
jgi:hypothetical protein